jgi:hypothetical protein
MLSETDILDRAKYCYCVLLQLSWLHSNDSVEPAQYVEYLNKSSLDLGNDRFIIMNIEEAMMENRPDAGLLSLIALYEGFVHAFCEVLEKDLDSVKEGVSGDFLQVLASEMGVQIKLG